MSTASDHPVVVIGGGLGGLAAACVSAARGHRTLVLEASERLGGKAAVLREGGFRFDMGPTILTLPSVLRRIFAEAGTPLDRELPLVRLDPQWRSFFHGGGVLDLVADESAMAERLEGMQPGMGARWRAFQARSRRLHDIAERWFFWRPVGGVGETLRRPGALHPRTLGDLLSLGMGRSVAGEVRRHLGGGRVAQMADHFTQYVGSCPESSPAVLCGIASMQVGEGVWYPVGGIGAIATALERLARRLGVEVRTGVPIGGIDVEDGAVRGVRTARGERIDAAAVISNADAVRTYGELLGGRWARGFAGPGAPEPACSGVVLYLGLDRAYGHLLHHNFVFSEDPHAEFDAIYRRGEPAEDPTCYVCAPAASDPGVAPAGGEALYVLVHTPYLRPHHDWSRMLPAYRRRILDKLARVAGLEDIERRIVFERTLTPWDIQERYRVRAGAIYGSASHGRFAGAFKPSNRSPGPRGLYLAGGAAHPGPGMPMVLMSGWIAADALDTDLARHAARRA